MSAKRKPKPTVAEALAGMVDERMSGSDRSLYAASKRIGVSDIGGCHEYARRLIADEDFTDPRTDYLAAFVGTAIGRELEDAYIARFPTARAQMAITVPIDVLGYRINLPGHPDIVDTDNDRLIDFKTKERLAVIRRLGYEEKHLFQVALYAHALIQTGDLTEHCTVALAYYDRSGVDQEPHVYEFSYDPAIYEAAVAWLEEVIQAQIDEEEASKDMPRDWCASYCPYFTSCRGLDTDVTGLIEDEHILSTIDLYLEAHAAEKDAAALKKSAAAELRGVAGQTGTHTLRWIHINETEIPATKRSGYDRIDLRARR